MNIIRRREEFGFTYKKICKKIFDENGLPAPVLANSVPKAGTNLLMRLLYLTPFYSRTLSRTLTNSDEPTFIDNSLRRMRPGKFSMAHLYYKRNTVELLSDYNIKCIFMVRHPLSIAVSNMNYIDSIDKKHRLSKYFHTLGSEEKKLEASIYGVASEELNGDTESRSIVRHLKEYAGWMDAGQCLIVRFEDLIGASGGGDSERQLSTIGRIFEYLGVTLDDEILTRLSDDLYSPSSRTFHSGQVNSWRKTLSRYPDLLNKIEESKDIKEISKLYGYDFL